MSIQKNILLAILVILILFTIIGSFFYSRENENYFEWLTASILQQLSPEQAEEEDLVPATFAPGKLLVRFKDNVPEAKQKKLLKDWGFALENEIKQIKVKIINVPEQAEEALAKALSKNPNIDWAEIDGIVEALSVPNDPWFSRQWGMTMIQAPEAWDVTTGSSSINIAILDTGIDQDHPDLADKITSNINFTSSPTVDDIYGHGTHCAGIASAITNNSIGVAGVCPGCSLMNVKVLNDYGNGTYSGIVNGIIWAVDNGANVLSMSLAGSSLSSTLESAVNYAWSKGVVVVGAAGNSGSTTPSYPAAHTNCMAVAATNGYDDLASFSNYGDWLDVAAPGVAIYATLKDSGYGYKGGTSMACPHVAGLAGLVFTAVSDTNGDGKLNDEVRSRIEATCDDIGVSGIGSGRINANKAVGGTVPPSPPPTPPSDTTSPTVSITSPQNNSTVSGTISVNVSATDNIAVSKLELYKDGDLFASDNTSPYSFVWDTTQDINGSHILQAKAYDTSTNTSASSITVTVSNNPEDTTPPEVSIISPTDGQTVPSGGKLLIEVTATDNVKVTQIDLLVNNKLITSCFDVNACYNNFRLNKLKDGTHTITARAYDAQNNMGQASITVEKAEGTSGKPGRKK